MKHKQIYFIEQYVDHTGRLLQTPQPTEIRHLEVNLESTRQSQNLKTVAVWIITPKKTNHDNTI